MGLLDVRVNGMRGALGRFESMSSEATLQSAFGRLDQLMEDVSGIYREHAPKSKEHDESKGPPFAETFHGEHHVAGYGFETSVLTSDPQLAKWLREGTRPHDITAVMAGALHWTSEGGDMFAATVHHPGTAANPWEDRAKEEAMPLLREHGNKIGSHITASLAGKAIE